MKKVRTFVTIFFIIVILLLCVVFVSQNGDHIRVNLFEYSTPQYPIWLFVLGALVIGVLLMLLTLGLSSIRTSLVIRKQRQRIDQLETEVQQLRNLPIDDLPQNPQVEVATLVDESNA
jgi:uncharacterized integral membrane protein